MTGPIKGPKKKLHGKGTTYKQTDWQTLRLLEKLDQETLLCRTHLDVFFSKKLDYYRPHKNQVNASYKGHPIEFMVDFLDHLGPFGNIEDPLRPY